MALKHTLLASSALLAAFVGASAHAQTSSSSAASNNTIEELVVTAEKREQSLQDVPVAVSAFTDQRREIVGINSIQDMTNFTPGLVYNSSTDRISLRGVGRLTNVLTGDAAVANYNDGIYETFAVQAGRSTLFLDRVEILRGPQGTLYGRNAIGGAINEISKRPTETYFAEVRASYSNYDHAILEGAISGPITDKIQFRLAADWDRQTGGWVKNIVPGMPDEGGVINEWFAEAQLQGKFFDDKLDVWAKYGMGVWHNGAGGPGSQAEGWTNGPFPTYEFGPSGIQLNSGYGCSTGFGVSNVVNVSPQGCVNPQYDPNGLSKNAARTIARAIPYSVRLPVYNTEAIHVTWHAKDFDIKYLTGGVNYHYQLRGPTQTAGGNLGNASATPITFYQLASGARIFPQEDFLYREYNQFWSHELNIISTWDSPLQYVLGAYYFNQHINQPVYTELKQQKEWNGPFLAPSVFCAPTGGVCAPETGNRRYDNRPRSESTSYAFFGQLDWQATPQWKATVGLRYSHDRKQGQEQVRILCFGAATCYGVPGEVFGANIPVTDITVFSVNIPAPGAPLPRGIVSPTTFDPATGFAGRKYDATWQAATGTAGIEWQPDSSTNAYFKYSRGYKAGGFYVGIFTFLAPDAYAQKESVDSFEIGLKKDIGSHLQANLAAYYYKYDNLQVPISVFSGFGQIATNFYNVPKSISKGFEAEVTWLPIDNLQLLLSYSYNDAYIKNGTALDTADPAAVEVGARPIGALQSCVGAAAGSAPCDPFTGVLQRSQSLNGATLPNAPKNKLALNATYTWHEVVGGTLNGSVSFIYRDTQYGSLFSRSYNKAPDWTQVDARLTWDSGDKKTRVIAYVKNLFDDLQYDAGAFGSRFVGQNINPVTGATVLVNQGIFKTYSLSPPRTFGVEVQYKFF
ncbi:TonB-dependent receptor [Phenylobacterium sp.]|uniref:TonB-dependent receptor n=1 Tax=Phenylobacterium sp. TaxID=1871053 RepID=UPI0025EBDA44|nr:TonB-dependent receptor [Phenylobacterium sp.]